MKLSKMQGTLPVWFFFFFCNFISVFLLLSGWRVHLKNTVTGFVSLNQNSNSNPALSLSLFFLMWPEKYSRQHPSKLQIPEWTSVFHKQFRGADRGCSQGEGISKKKKKRRGGGERRKLISSLSFKWGSGLWDSIFYALARAIEGDGGLLYASLRGENVFREVTHFFKFVH